MNVPRIGVVAAAGRGQRIHPRSATVPKVLLDVAGKPLLTRQLELLRDACGIRDIHVVVGHLAPQVRAAYGDGAGLGVRLTYHDNPDVDRGLGTLLGVIEPHVREPFVLLLGDELYVGSNHAALGEVPDPWAAVCGVVETDDPEVVRKNYAVALDGDRVVDLVEKPAAPDGRLAGVGTYVLRPDVYADARATPPSPRTGRLELTDVLARIARRGGVVRPFVIRGAYVNVNTVDDLNLANLLCRSQEFARRRKSVVIPAWNEAASIGFVVRDFRDHVDEVVVMDNASSDGTAAIARDAGAVVYSRPYRGYGDALRRGLDAATGEILILVEADATFRAHDLGKLFEYLKDADMVVGTRTTRQMIEQGANMDGLLRWGNVAVGKLIEALWWGLEPRFTDVGCTYRAIWRDAWAKIRPYVTRDDAAFSPEMMIEMLRVRGRVIEVPVSYYRRRGGTSKHSSSRWHSVRTGLRMLGLILAKRVNVR